MTLYFENQLHRPAMMGIVVVGSSTPMLPRAKSAPRRYDRPKYRTILTKAP
jgi:hypothetical protein